MKKLEKLTLKDLGKSVSILDQKEISRLKGGDGSSDDPFYCPGESICYGGPGGAAIRALNEVGYCELDGSKNSTHIMNYFMSCNGDYSNTSGWCSAFVNSMFQAAGLQGTDDGLASSWLNWGVPTTNPQVGDVAIYPDGSHCGIVTSVENGVVKITYGNSGSGCVKTSSYGVWVYRTGGN